MKNKLQKLLFGTFFLCINILNAQITTYPYTEDFETGPGGWVANNASLGTWALGSPIAPIINSAASGVNAWVTNLTGLYNNSENSWVESPLFDFTSVPNPAINAKIWWNAEFSWDGMVLQSSIDGGLTWQNVGLLNDPGWYNDATINGNPGGQQIGWSGRISTSNGSGGWVTAFHLLNGLGGQSSVRLRFAFGADGSVTDEGVAFDLVNIVNLSCNVPSALNVTNVTSTSVDAGWTTNSTATSFQVQYGLQGFALGTGTNIISGTNPTTIPSLLPNTQYSYYVRNICGVGDTSFWAGPLNFTTLPDYCGGDHFYDNGGAFGNYANNSNDTTIICPSTLGAIVTVTFNSFDTEAGFDFLTIFNGSGVTGTPFGTFDGSTIPGPFTSTDITGCLTFVFESDGSVANSGWDATIVCASSCSAPSNLTAFNIQPTSAMLDWTENGTATNWNIEWDVTGFILGTGNPQAVAAKPYLLQGLMPGTSYDYYVQADCGLGDTSNWVGPYTFMTPPCMPIALNLGADTTICSTDTLTLDAGAGSYIYNWSMGATTQIVNLDTSIFGGNGTYTIIVAVTDFNTGCVYQDDINVTFSTCVGIDEKASLLNVNIYPNPNKGQFTIKLNNKNTTDLRISVTNVQGQEVFVKNNFDNLNIINEQINIGSVKGIYFVNIITNNEVLTKKIIIQ